jgi:hypothetical protein
LIIAVGYDAYGNYRGPENSNWTVNGTLHPIDKPMGVPRVFYETGQVRYDEDGYIRASATGKGGVVVSDSMRVIITGRAATLMSAVTHDTSGNGLLDEITLVFDLKVTLLPGARIQLSNGSYTLVVSSIRGQASGTSATIDNTTGLLQGTVGSDSVFTVVLIENNKTIPQTVWKPALTISGVPGMFVVNFFTVTDGAGPAIWSIVKTINSPSDRAQDKVTVTFSEPIGTNGNDFSMVSPPASIFRVWERTTTGVVDTFIEVAGLLNGITSFYQVENNGLSVSFYMSNGQDLTTRDYLNIVFDSNSFITDKNPPLVNRPVQYNQRVAVTVTSSGAVLPGLLKPLPPKLRILFPGAGSFVFPLPPDVSHSRLFFTLYSLSGRVVFKTEVADAGKPVSVNFQIRPGIYLVSLRTADRQVVKSRFVLIK